MVLALKRGDVRLGVARMLLWALTMGCARRRCRMRVRRRAKRCFCGRGVRIEMFGWVLTGRGPESTPSEFIPQQAGHAAMFGSRWRPAAFSRCRWARCS
jgi:hypothetical protein